MPGFISIIYENDDYLVINKPAGLLVHGSEQIKEKTLADWLLEHYPAVAKVGDDPSRPGITHRLDRLASGLLAVAKNQASFENLKKQFQERKVRKLYTALVHGKISRDEGEILFPISRGVKGYKMAALPLTSKGEKKFIGRPAETVFKVAKRFINFTLLKVSIKTGRTHQIRAHLAAYGFPIVGDYVYGTKKTREKNKKLDMNRLFLVADELEFADLAGNVRSYKIELPPDLQKLLERIK